MHWLKTKSEPLKLFISGGAGVGKSVLCRALIKAMTKYYDLELDKEKAGDASAVLVMAPTGKAAFVIGGEFIFIIHITYCKKFHTILFRHDYSLWFAYFAESKAGVQAAVRRPD